MTRLSTHLKLSETWMQAWQTSLCNLSKWDIKCSVRQPISAVMAGSIAGKVYWEVTFRICWRDFLSSLCKIFIFLYHKLVWCCWRINMSCVFQFSYLDSLLRWNVDDEHSIQGRLCHINKLVLDVDGWRPHAPLYLFSRWGWAHLLLEINGQNFNNGNKNEGQAYEHLFLSGLVRSQCKTIK